MAAWRRHLRYESEKRHQRRRRRDKQAAARIMYSAQSLGSSIISSGIAQLRRFGMAAAAWRKLAAQHQKYRVNAASSWLKWQHLWRSVARIR